jgi:hypothetical protein
MDKENTKALAAMQALSFEMVLALESLSSASLILFRMNIPSVVIII